MGTTALSPARAASLLRGWVGDRIGGWAAESRLGYLADILFDWSDMSLRDREYWAAARTLADLGALTKAWLYGDLHQTPFHGGPPCEETLPYVRILADANLTGFVTTGSQAGGESWNADVCGFLDDAGLARMRHAIAGSGPVMESCCRGNEHQVHASTWRGCPVADQAHFYAERCPSAADAISGAWFIIIADPENDRNDRLWPMLERFAGITS